MAEKKDNRYVSDNARLMAEWNWESNDNIGLNPYTILQGSNKKAHWKCGNGHYWEAVIATRTKGVGCPYCSNRKVLIGYNDLGTTHPQLAKQWHPYKNGSLSPFDVTAGSDKKVWWICECGHEWESRIANRKLGNGCPACKNTVISQKMSKIHIAKSGSLNETHPSLAKEWHPNKNGQLTPSQLTAGSGQLVWWIGSCGHEWQASPSNRSNGTNCPYCSNQKVLQGFNDLATTFPEIALEWHPFLNKDLLPSDVVGTSNKNVWWLGKCGHVWEQKIANRTKRQQGCPICAKRLQTSFPEQALFFYIKRVASDAINTFEALFDNQMELDIFIPSLKVAIEYDGENWHSDADSIRKEKEKYTICQQNGIRLIRVRENAINLSSEISDLIIDTKRHPTYQDLDLTISNVLKILGFAYDVNTELNASSIRENYLGRVAEKSLLECRADVAATWHPTKNGRLAPNMFTEHSGIKVWWLCPVCGNEWEARIATRSAGVGCKLCGYKKRATSRVMNRIEQEGSLADHSSFLAEEWHPTKNGKLLPTDVMKSSGKKVWWFCKKCGHEWEARIQSRTRGNGCPECAKQKRKKN